MSLKSIKSYIQKSPLATLLVAVAVIFLVTPVYGLGYIILISLSLKHLGFIKTLESGFGRFILGILVLVSAIMLTGLISWLVHVAVYPLAVALVFALIVYTLIKTNSDKPTPIKIINRGDIISIALALIAPLIIVVSFLMPNPSYASVYQFLTNGWDNGSHLVMLETASTEKGYVYGPDAEVLPKTIGHSGAYPQAWHLATSNIANGFGVNLFNPQKPLQAIGAYMVVALTWYFIAVFLFSRTAWNLIEPKINKDKSALFVVVFSFSMANLLIQLGAFWGALTVGFANYVACMALLVATTAAIIDSRNKNNATYILTLLFGTATVLSWFLPLPAVGLMILGAYWIPKKSIFSTLKPTLSYTYIATVLAVVAVVFQVGIFIVFSEVSGEAQLNNGHLSGAFAGGELLLFVAVITLFAYWIIAPNKLHNITNKVVAIVGSVIILVGLLYAYQLVTSGEVSYYFGKAMRLALVVVGVFFVAAFTGLIHHLVVTKKLSRISALILAASLIGILVIASNQSLLGLTKLFQKNSLIGYQTAEVVVDFLDHKDPNDHKLVILRHKSNIEDYNSKLDVKVTHIPYACTYEVVTAENSSNLDEKIKKLDDCAKTLNKKIIVITSDLTKNAVAALHRKNIEIVNVP